MRKLHIHNQEWQYRVGEGTIVVVRPNGKKLYIDCHKVKGLSPDDFDRGKWKKTSDGMITPRELKQYIEEHYE